MARLMLPSVCVFTTGREQVEEEEEGDIPRGPAGIGADSLIQMIV